MAITEEHSRRRRKHTHGEQNTIDRISDLPDSVLCHILSFLRTKFSVRTSILAQRWRYLWAYVTNLHFKYDNQEMVNSVMLVRRVQNIDTLRLFHNCSEFQLRTWVTFAIVRNVQKLDLRFHSRDDLPRCLFTCKTLVDLRLNSCGFIPKSGAVCLPRLKKLQLLYVLYDADESLPHLLSGCPVLEELSIKFFDGMVYCNVSSPTLKRLMLDFVSEDNGGSSETLEITTPALEYLQIIDSFSDHIKCGVLTSVTEADIDLSYDDKPDYFPYSRSLLEFIDRFCNVKCLKLDFTYCPTIIDSVVYAWNTSFRNLTKLHLTADIRFLSMFLKNADNLEILVFSEVCDDIEGWVEPPQQVLACLLSHLRIVKLANIPGEKHEFGYIKYILRNAKVLETMEITYAQYLTPEEKINMLQKISRYERGSAACKVAFVKPVKWLHNV